MTRGVECPLLHGSLSIPIADIQRARQFLNELRLILLVLQIPVKDGALH